MSRKHDKHKLSPPQQPEVEQFSKRGRLASYIFLTVLVIVTYANTYNAAFVSDDTYGILNNPLVTSWTNVTGQVAHFFQPLLYFLMSNIFGLVPFAFRFWNILAHIGNVQMVFIIVSSLFTPLAGFFAAGIFAVHPMFIESVTWISGGTFSWFTFFMLLSWYCYMKKQRMNWYIGSILSYAFGLTLGAPGVVFVGVLTVYEYCFGNLKKNWKYLLIFYVLSTLYGIILLKGIGPRQVIFKEQHYQSVQYYNWFLQMPVAISKYFEIYFWPAALSLYHSEMQFTTTQFVFRVVGMSMYFIVLIVAFFKQKKYFLLLSIYLIGLVPTLTPQTIHWVTAERYAYLSMVGIVALTGVLLARIPKKYELPLYFVYAAVIVALMTRSIVRNNDWKNEDNLWLATSKTSPSDPKTHNNMADVYVRHGEYKKAVEELLIAIKINPNYADAYHNLANVYQHIGQVDAAVNLYNYALKINPHLWQTHQNLASVYFNKGDFARSEAEMTMAWKLNPGSMQLLGFVGFIQLKAGKKAEAIQTFRQVLSVDPANQVAQAGIADASK